MSFGCFLRRQEDHRRLLDARIELDLPHHFEPVHVGHHDVADDQVRACGARMPAPGPPGHRSRSSLRSRLCSRTRVSNLSRSSSSSTISTSHFCRGLLTAATQQYADCHSPAHKFIAGAARDRPGQRGGLGYEAAIMLHRSRWVGFALCAVLSCCERARAGATRARTTRTTTTCASARSRSRSRPASARATSARLRAPSTTSTRHIGLQLSGQLPWWNVAGQTEPHGVVGARRRWSSLSSTTPSLDRWRAPSIRKTRRWSAARGPAPTPS